MRKRFISKGLKVAIADRSDRVRFLQSRPAGGYPHRKTIYDLFN